jgi:hypothetical protein
MGTAVGLAYSPDAGKTAFRAAYGISYFPDNFGATGGTLERNYPFFQIIDVTTPTPLTPFRTISDGLPGFQPVPLQPHLTPPPGFAVWVVSRDFRQDTAQMWNFSIQRQITPTLMADAAYVATRGTHIYRNRNINVPFPDSGPVDPRRPFYGIAPNVTAVNQRNGDGASSYQSAQFKLVKRYNAGLTFLASYTFAKSIDNYTSILFPLDDRLNRGLSAAGGKAVDIPHNFTFSYSYELPFGTGKRWFSGSRALDLVAGGWSVNGVTTFRSGQPLAISADTQAGDPLARHKLLRRSRASEVRQ